MYLADNEDFNKILIKTQREMNIHNLTDKIFSFNGIKVHIHRVDCQRWHVNTLGDEINE